jgi:hypothetical protein
MSGYAGNRLAEAHLEKSKISGVRIILESGKSFV